MSEGASGGSFAGTVPENYERYLVPLIFEDYAADLAACVDVASGGAVLETACGTGVVTRHLATALPEGVRITASDLNPGMLEVARRRLASVRTVTFREADATSLPFPDGSFDALVCQFGVMFYPDKDAGYREAARVLKPGGWYHFNVWDALSRNPVADTAHETVVALYADDPPRFLELPFAYHDQDTIRDALESAGFADVEVEVSPKQGRAPSAHHVALALVAGSPLANQLAERETPSPAQALDAVERALAERFGAGEISAPMQAIRISARRA